MTLDVVTSFGEPVKFVMVHIDSIEGSGSSSPIHNVFKFHGRTSFPLREGTYRFSCEALGDTWPIERTVDIVGPQSYVLLAVPRREAYAMSGEGSAPVYTVEGRVVRKGGAIPGLFVRVHGVYLSTAIEGQLDKSGHFKVVVPYQGDYEFQVVGGGSVLAHKPVHFDESTEERVRMQVAIP